MALTFPASPSVGQQYTEGSKTWQWSGDTWDAVSSSDLSGGTLVLPTHSTPDTIEASIVWNPDTDSVTVGTGLDSLELAKITDVPSTLTDLGIVDGTVGQLLQTDGAGAFTFIDAPVVPTVLTDLGIVDGTVGQVLVTDGAGTFTFTDNTAATTLDSLTDVTAAGATAGQVLTADGVGGFAFALVNDTDTMGGLQDVDAASATAGQVLIADGDGTYSFTTVAGVTSTLASLTDIDFTGETNGQVLTTDGAGNYSWTTITHTPALDDLTDVTAAGAAGGTVLTADGLGAFNFIAVNDTDTMSGLQDVDAASATTGQLLQCDGDGTYSFIDPPSPSTALDDLSDVTAAGSTAGQVLTSDGAGSYTFQTISSTPALNDLSDVIATGSTAGQVLTSNGAGAYTFTDNSHYDDTDTAAYLGGLNTHIIPSLNATFDIGAAEYKIRHLYLSNNSLKFVDASNTEYSMGVDGDGELTFNAVKVSDGAISKIASQDLDMGGNRVLFANVYTNVGDLPDASAYHGMFAHVHTEAAAYYAHAGNWVALANKDSVPGALTDLGIVDGTNGQVLSTDGAGNFTFVTASGVGGSLAGLADVDVTGETAGQVLTTDGAGSYSFTTISVATPSLATLSDVDVTGEISGQVLTTDGAGNYSFAAASTAVRNQYSGTTISIADQTSTSVNVSGCKGYILFKVSTDVAAWVTLYTDEASRTADTRTYADKGTDPSTSGVIAEVITTGAETVVIAPGVFGYNNESTPVSTIPIKVWNDSGSSSTITVTIDVLTLEA